MTMLDQARKELRPELERVIASDRCRCSQSKAQHATPFCEKCFNSLPRDMRKLWKWLYRNYRYWKSSLACASALQRKSAEDLVLQSIGDGHVSEYDRCLDLLKARRRGEVIHRRREDLEEMEVPA